MNRWIALALFIISAFVIAAIGGSATASSVSDWYLTLEKPPWNPPGWVFGPVWTALYIMMAVAAWLVWREGRWKARKRALGLYLLQWALNALWTPLFFALHQPGWAFAEIAALLLTVLATLAAFWQVRRSAGLLLIPYALWVAFAAALNFTIWRLNG